MKNLTSKPNLKYGQDWTSLLLNSNLWPVSGKILSLDTDLSPPIKVATIVFCVLKITSTLKIFCEKLAPDFKNGKDNSYCGESSPGVKIERPR